MSEAIKQLESKKPAKKIKKPETKHFVIVKDDGTETGSYKGRTPRQAALKAARDCGGTKEKPAVIRLRARKTKKLHVFNAWKAEVAAPAIRPKWMSEKIMKGFVTKTGTQWIE